MPRVALHAASTPLGVRPPPPSFAPFPDPVHVRGTRSAGPHGTTPAPSPVYPQWGARPPFAPFPYARKGGAGQETRTPPPPPLLTRERGAAQEDTRTRDKPPPQQPPLPFARKEGWRTGTRCTGQDAGWRGTRHVHPPLSPLAGDLARNARGGAAPPPRFARRGHAHEGSVRGDENGTAPHTLCAPPPFARTGRARTRARAPGWRASEPGGHAGAKRERAHARQRPPLPLPRVRAPGQNASGRPRGSPPSPAGSRARAKRERATTRKPPLSRGFARKGETQPRGGSAPSSVYAGVHRSGGA
ncbi:hypothetical protein EDB89DRAFT_2072660 [Lactarius sanguifluus]|nr:hypothetical protein EDB89DRAFT_2072660 [Lactarius sanguifluus]